MKMKLDRNLGIGRGKYALIKLRDDNLHFVEDDHGSESVFVPSRSVDFGSSPNTEFFVIRLKDKYAAPALFAYADAAQLDDAEYAEEIRELARQADHFPHKHQPD
jgi:hypothetical protein